MYQFQVNSFDRSLNYVAEPLLFDAWIVGLLSLEFDLVSEKFETLDQCFDLEFPEISHSTLKDLVNRL